MVLKSDFLVMGSGIAGLSFALKAAERGTVAIVAKNAATDTNTNLAQGGIAAVMGTDDLTEYHVRDTLEAGAGLCREETVKLVVESGPKMIEELEALDVPFTRRAGDPSLLELGREGGHSRRRIIHAKDMTGQAVQKVLAERAMAHPNIEVREFHAALDLILESDSRGGPPRAGGAWVLDIKTGIVKAFLAKRVILATGGSGKVYLYTTNPDGATGDGLAIGRRAGAKVANMEFVQFHPTCLYHPLRTNFLISEAVRGEGGVLINKEGERIMRDHPRGDLACRDVVALTIDAEMKRTGQSNMFLDITGKDPDFTRERFPKIHDTCLSLGLDITKEPIPVVPAAHYQCGGLLVDIDAATNVPGLYAIGEVACTGLHGANRLASNSLLEALVMADRAAKKAAAEVPGLSFPKVAEPELWTAGRLGRAPAEAVLVTHSWEEIRRFMWNYVGLVRSDQRLSMARKRLSLVMTEIDEFFRNFEVDADLVEVRNIAIVADLIIQSAILRKESRGLHYSLDWPNRDDEHFKRDTVLENPLPSVIPERAPGSP
ncbi:MAG: L-aspartate oxidase [Deltaproteobacteria bacterium]|jgi:L-aspartate oxidase|nr:L-aspartate oxidase [Deltaproteobacteria bacterium]